MRFRGRFWLGICFASLAAIGLAEWVAERNNPMPHEGFPPGLFIPDDERGYAQRPGFSGRYDGGVSFAIDINRSGYRGPDFPADKRPAILLLGSSATFGLGVEEPQTFRAQIEGRLGSPSPVVNAGVYGYGPPQSLRTLLRECRSHRVAIAVYIYEYKMPRADFLLEQSRTVSNGTVINRQPGPSIAPPASRWPDAVRLVGLRAFLSQRGWHPSQLWARWRGFDDRAALTRDRAMTANAADFPSHNIAVVAEWIGRLAAAAQECGASFVLAVLPDASEAFYGIREPATEAVLSQIGNSIEVWDLRSAIEPGTVSVIPGMDYPRPEVVARLAAEIAARLDARHASTR